MNVQSKIFNTTFKGINQTLLFPPTLLNFQLFPQFNNFPKYKAINEPEENKELCYISKKRGRKNKDFDKDDKNKNKIQLERKIHNKFSNDNVKRRLKALFHNYIINLLNNLMKQKLKVNKIKFVKISSKITKEIGIEYNRKLLGKQIKDIIINVSDKYQNKDNNKECIEYIKKQKDNEEIIQILNMTYRDLYSNYYLKSIKNDMSDSNSYEEHKENLLKEYGKEYLNIFIENAEKFVDFFTYGKNRKSRKKKETEIISHCSENEMLETTNTNEQISDDNIEKYYLSKNMVSFSTQTDICDINTKIIAFV